MIYAALFALLAVASAQNSVTIKVPEAERMAGENAKIHCTLETSDWSISGLDSIAIHKKQDGDFKLLSDKSNIQAPFLATGRFSDVKYHVDFVNGKYQGTLNLTVSDLKPADSGTYKCVQTRTENSVVTILLESSEVAINVFTRPQSVSLSSSLVNPLPNVTVTEPLQGSNYDMQFNWEIGQQVIVTCQADGGYPDPLVKITKNNGEDLKPSLVGPTLTWKGDADGLKEPHTSTKATINPYVPASGDKTITCSSQVKGMDEVKQVAKVTFAGQLEVVCPPKSEAKQESNDHFVMCTATSSDDLTSVKISFKGFTDISCKKGSRNDMTRAGNGVFCRYDQVQGEPDKYIFEMKLSNVDSGKYQKYTYKFMNAASQETISSTEVVKVTTGGSTDGVAMVIPSIALLLFSLFLAL